MSKSRPSRSLRSQPKRSPSRTAPNAEAEIFQFEPDMLPPEAKTPLSSTLDSTATPAPEVAPSSKESPERTPEQATLVPKHLPRRFPQGRFWLALLLQLGLILPVPLRNAYVAVAGETIVLDTVAVDPYDIFRGYSQTLAYPISDADTFEELPGYEIVQTLENRPQSETERPEAFYVLLAAPNAPSDLSGDVSPESWQPVGIVRDRPQNLPANQVALRANHNGNAIIYNLERYYMPEGQRNEINRTVQELQRSDIGEVKVEVKVDRFGKAIPVSLWLGDQRYQF